MRSRRLILGLVSWLVVVALTSTLAWAVISRAGDTLVSTDEPAVVTQTEGGHAASKGTARTAKPKPSTSPTVTTRSPETQPPAPTSISPSTTSETPSSTAAPSPAASTSTASPDTPTESTREPQRRTWQGIGGRLVVACDGSRISFVSALPDAGFKYEVGGEGPDGLEVEFQGGDDQDGEGSHVKATCLAGVPDFNVETRGQEDDE